MTGAPLLQPTCAGCGQHVHAGEEVCGGCGTPTAQAQRRVVTILFADLSGYTALCHDRDPEEVHLLVRPLMNALRRVCEAHGAMVPSIEGDGFMAAFGARVASEDDPTQALSAAIEMQQLVRARAVVVPELPGLHIGVHLGEVVVAPTWEDVGLSLSGDAVNVASRLCDRAGSGEVLASSEVARLSRFGDGWADAAPFHLRGRMEPVTASAYAWADGGAELRSPRWGGASPYVRRSSVEQELATALARGENVVLVGEAGVGKSRIVAEGVPRGASRVSCAGSRHPSARERA